MIVTSPSPTTRVLIAGAAAAGGAGLLPATMRAACAADAIRQFRIDVPEADLADLRRRITATHWPDRQTVADHSQGVPLAKLQTLVRQWGAAYDWRKVEARLNALPQFVTEIDGLDVQFAHVRSRHANALPIIVTHGWPGSMLELLKIAGPLTAPTAHRGRDEGAFHVVLPSMPGYGFSAQPQGTGRGADRVALTWAVLVGRLSHMRYVWQGSDWGSMVADVIGRQAATANSRSQLLTGVSRSLGLCR